ncbi:MAG: flavodoxin [Clostridia bacterium]|nr:flavodoxin [Clostridia bacterium]
MRRVVVWLTVALLTVLTACSLNGAPEEGPNVLVAYYSASGNTRRVAENIAEATGGDTFEIVPQEPYTEEDLAWQGGDSRVLREHESPELQNVPLANDVVPDWDSYDVVFIGYPIWWGEAAWPAATFASSQDFSGKTVVAFCTSSSSGIGMSWTELAERAGTGEWKLEKRFPSDVDTATVRDWVKSLELP